MFFLGEPSSSEIDAFLARQGESSPSYEPVGLALGEAVGYTLDRARGEIGRGEGDFERAKRAVREWRMFDLGWIRIFPDGAVIEPGTVVAVRARHLGFRSLNACRVVYALPDSPTRFGFAYGTLADHAERGEESFAVELGSDGAVSYEIRAASRPASILARLGYPITRLLQARFRRDSLAAMGRAVREG